MRKALNKSGMSIEDIDLIELNEAFAAQALYCMRELDMDIDKTNVNGSGISLGHPIGATGAIMTVKLMEEIGLRDQELGLVTMCVGGGQGVATNIRARGLGGSQRPLIGGIPFNVITPPCRAIAYTLCRADFPM